MRRPWPPLGGAPCSSRRGRRPRSLAPEVARRRHYRCILSPPWRGPCYRGRLYSKQAAQLLEQAVPVALLRRLFQRNGGLVQELVEQRLAELLDLHPILGTQMRELTQRPVQLRSAQRVHLLAPFLDGRHHAE